MNYYKIESKRADEVERFFIKKDIFFEELNECDFVNQYDGEVKLNEAATSDVLYELYTREDVSLKEILDAIGAYKRNFKKYLICEALGLNRVAGKDDAHEALEEMFKTY